MAEEVLDYALVRTLQSRVADRLTTLRQERSARGEAMSDADERQLAMSLEAQVVSEHMQAQALAGRELPDRAVDMKLMIAIDAAIYGAGEMQELLDDDLVENININGADEVWVTYADDRGKVRGRPVAASDEDLIDIVQGLAAYSSFNARPFTRAHPELDLRLHDGSRLSAVISSTERPAVSIRRNRFPQMFLPTLVELGTIDEQLANFLQAAVRSRANIVVAGATDAGKTTLLRALINCIDPIERLVTVERAIELGLRRHPKLHPDVVELEEVLPDSDGNGGLTIAQLVRRTRRMDPSRVIVGEVLGPEVLEMLSAMSQGNNGSLSTIHSRNAREVFQRLATYAAQHEHLDWAVTNALVAAAIDFVVFIQKNPKLGGIRCVTEVLEVEPHAGTGKDVAASRIFVPSPVDGRAARAVEIKMIRADELAGAGYVDTASWG